MTKRLALALSALFISFSYSFASVPLPPLNDEVSFTIVEKNELKGLFDEEGKMIIPIAYEDLGWTTAHPKVFHKVIGYRENNKWGLINVKNTKVTEAQYYSLSPFFDKLIIASKGGRSSRKAKYGLINTKGEIALSFRYSSLEANHEQLIASMVVNQEIAYGLIDEEGQAVIGFQYNKITPLSAKSYAVFNAENKLALFSAEGDELTSFKYDSISPFNSFHLAKVYQNGKQGIINEAGQLVLPVEYQKVRISENGEISALPFSKWHTYTGDNKKIKTYTFEDMEPAGLNLYQIKLGGVASFVDAEGKLILDESWQIDELKHGFAVLRKGRKYGLMKSAHSSQNEIILDTVYDTLFVAEDYLLAAQNLGEGVKSWFMYDTDGNKLTSFAYQQIRPARENLLAVKRKDYWGYINMQGEEVIPCQYLSVSDFSQHRASVDFIDGQGIIDTYGNWTIKPFKYEGASLHLKRIHDNLYIFSTDAYRYESARHGLVDSEGNEIYVGSYPLIDNGHTVWEVNEQGKYGLLTYNGKRILDTKYDTISALQEGTVYTFEKEGHFGILNRDGEVLVDLDNNFQDLYPMSNHYLGVKIEDKFGFVDTLGRLRIANRYDSISRFQSNMAAIKLLGRWGYIDRFERLVVQPHFEEARAFVGGLAIVKKEGKYGMVNKKGETIVPNQYYNIRPTLEDRYIVEQEKEGKDKIQMGLVSHEGHALIYPKYDTVDDLGNGFVIISRNGRYGLLTLQGKSTIPLKYDLIKYDPYNEVYLVLEEQGWKSFNLPTQVAGN
ncbi:WG repeat-containing protein [Porifericola rhodea]|uniref:WG repeat-containing protein n=1 Tax=Porifericola rhodea TaxID=930972 RepID=UPI002665AC1C|nr:WG repeat-containing protein [Porifericola rhodea]WKN32378.1 WG repeat-containing protein [Porifericola rhodea]